MDLLPSPVPSPLASPPPISIDELERYRDQLSQVAQLIARYKPLIDKYGATLQKDLEEIAHSPNWGLWIGCQAGWFFAILAFKHAALGKSEGLIYRGAIRVFFGLLFWTGSAIVIPHLVFGDPYARLLHFVWDLGQQLVSQKL